jgi:glycosyltransferase involved in cell wall biosynthesis
MSNYPIITVYIINHNYGQYIEEAIRSVINQKYKKIDIIIVDDKSSDNSAKIISKYEKKKNIRIIYNSKKLGLIKSSNIAIRASTGEFVLRLDADDILHKNCIIELYKKIKKNKNVAVAYSDFYEIDKSGNIISVQKQMSIKNKNNLKDRPILAACCLIRKSTLFSVNLYDEKYSRQDGYDLWYKIIKDFDFAHASHPLFFYRKHNNNLTKKIKKLHKTRSKILYNFAKNNLDNLKIVIIIPVRGPRIDKLKIFKLHRKKPFIFNSIDESLKTKNVNKIILTSPDIWLLKKLKKKYRNKIQYHQRNYEQSKLNTSLKEGLLEAIKEIKQIDILVIILPQFAFDKAHYIEQAISKLVLHKLDKVVSTVVENEKNFYKYTSRGLKLISNDSNDILKYEKNTVLSESGGLIVYNFKSYLKNTVKKISNIILNENEIKDLSKS